MQVVLNTQDYIHRPEIQGGGSNEDFYGGRDIAFIEHKKLLLKQIDSTKEIISSSVGSCGIVKVELNSLALAKSHRPVRSLFPPGKSPQIGGLGIGKLLFQVTPSSLNWLKEKVEQTEPINELIYDNFKKKMVYKPSRARSETGAIENIHFYGAEDKTNFTVEEGLSWLSKERVAKGYIVELATFSEITIRNYELSKSNIFALEESLKNNLYVLGSGVVASKLSNKDSSHTHLYIRLFEVGSVDAKVHFDKAIIDRDLLKKPFDFNLERHELLMNILKNHVLVKRILLPPEISRSDVSAKEVTQEFNFPKRNLSSDYPKVGIVDAGIQNADVLQWCIGTSKGFDPKDCDLNHGSQVGSLIVGGKSLNPNLNNIEDDGCLLYDIWTPIHAQLNSFFEYFDGYGDFFDWLDSEVEIAKKKGIRIFNFSLNFKECIKDDSYSFSANQLDRISKKHDVLFVLSAGNLTPIDFRARWPSESALFTDIDRIFQPAEAITAITVGAINPPGCEKNMEGAPTVYSRRGPGVAMGVKPDVAHFGGYVTNSRVGETGLVSLNAAGALVEDSGTSFSAPLITKFLAGLEHRALNGISKQALVALMIHHSEFPDSMNKKGVSTSVKRRFVGFGVPPTSRDVLLTDDHTLTILFEGTLKKGEVVEFDFSWPKSLVKDGKCFGTATLSMVSDTIVDQKFGAEYCRINIDATLQQEKMEKNNWVYRKNCDSIWDTKMGKDANYEKSQIEHGLKWWPIKKFRKVIKTGVGKSSNWRLKMTSQERSFGEHPTEGVNFCTVLTIEDHKKESTNLFNELRLSLQASGVKVSTIEVSQEVNINTGQ